MSPTNTTQSEIDTQLMRLAALCNDIERVAGTIPYEKYVSDPAVRLLSERLLELIGNGLLQLNFESPGSAAAISNIGPLVELRYEILHDYDRLDYSRILEVCRIDIPRLSREIATLLLRTECERENVSFNRE